MCQYLVNLATAVPLTSILATFVFIFYIVLLKILLKPTPNIIWQDVKKGTWKWISWIRFSIVYLLAWSMLLVVSLLFIASLYNPSMLQHDLFYDVFLFRTNDNSLAGAHALDYLLIPALFFFCIFYWGRSKIIGFILSIDRESVLSLENKEYIFKAGLMCAFMVFFHEAIWFFFYYIKYWQVELDTLSDVVIGDLTFLVMIFTFFIATRMRYKEEFTKRLMYGAGIYALYIAIWFFFDDMRVTTVPKIVNGIPNAQTTIWYLDPLTNVLEVGSWILVFSIFVTVIILNHRAAQKKETVAIIEGLPKVV